MKKRVQVNTFPFGHTHGQQLWGSFRLRDMYVGKNYRTLRAILSPNNDPVYNVVLTIIGVKTL